MKQPIVLCILDGCGLREETKGNAFKNANKSKRFTRKLFNHKHKYCKYIQWKWWVYL